MQKCSYPRGTMGKSNAQLPVRRGSDFLPNCMSSQQTDQSKAGFEVQPRSNPFKTATVESERLLTGLECPLHTALSQEPLSSMESGTALQEGLSQMKTNTTDWNCIKDGTGAQRQHICSACVSSMTGYRLCT